jgi:hypothetical protein
MQATGCGPSAVVGSVGLGGVRLIVDPGSFPSMSWRRTKLLVVGGGGSSVVWGRRWTVVVGAVRGFVGGGGGRSWDLRLVVDGLCWISGWWWFVRGVRRVLPLVVGGGCGQQVVAEWMGEGNRWGGRVLGGKQISGKWGNVFGVNVNGWLISNFFYQKKKKKNLNGATSAEGDTG